MSLFTHQTDSDGAKCEKVLRKPSFLSTKTFLLYFFVLYSRKCGNLGLVTNGSDPTKAVIGDSKVMKQQSSFFWSAEAHCGAINLHPWKRSSLLGKDGIATTAFSVSARRGRRRKRLWHQSNTTKTVEWSKLLKAKKDRKKVICDTDFSQNYATNCKQVVSVLIYLFAISSTK